MAVVVGATVLVTGTATAGAVDGPDDAATPVRAAADGAVVGFGTAAALGAPSVLNRPLISMASVPGGDGYWLVAADGGIFSYGGATFYGSTGGMVLNAPVVDMTATPTGNGYWLVASDGGVFSFGDARFYGSTGSIRLNQPIASMVSTATGDGYWMVGKDGGVFAFGGARFYGSQPNSPNRVVDIIARPQGDGYWVIDDHGTVKAFGAAPDLGDLPRLGVNTTTIVGGAVSASGNGYWLTGTDGGVFTFGDAKFSGTAAPAQGRKVVGIAVKPDGQGYWLASTSGFLPASSGDAGPQVTAIQVQLGDLGYWIDGADGNYGASTAQAVMAFQKYTGLPRTGQADQTTVDALFAAQRPRGRATTGNVVEIDKARQVMYLIQNGVTVWTFNVSTGSQVPYRVVFNGTTYTGDAQTYDGSFKIGRVVDGGWHQSELGQLWRPRFFNGGIAIHGSLDIPAFGASHGCVRVSVAAMNWLWGSNSLPVGMAVNVYSD